MSQKLPVNKLEWIGDTSQINEDFMKRYTEESDEGLQLMLNILKNYINFIMIYCFCQKD